ncbi:MAG: hypothetical protein K6C34_03400 [Alphaproteobacteria bacterium]|nr:hypothetical protein [Alphaproteobacteria bacterium]
MYKNKLKLYALITAIIAFGVSDFYLFLQYKNLKNRNEELRTSETKIQNLVNNFSNQNILCFKSVNKLFAKNDIKQQIEKVAKKMPIENLQFKADENKKIEIKFHTKNETNAYDFLEKLYFEIGGVVHFSTLKIGRFSDNKIHVWCGIKTEMPQVNEYDISITPSKYQRPSIALFKRSKKHQLHCVIHDKKVFIDSRWYKVGDKIDEYQISKIEKSSVELKNAEKRVNVQLGHSW